MEGWADVEASLREDGRDAVLETLRRTRGAKALVAEGSLSAALGLLVTPAELASCNADRGIRPLSCRPATVPAHFREVVLFARPVRPELMDELGAWIAEDARESERTYRVVFVPARSELCEGRLRQKVRRPLFEKSVTVEECALHVFPRGQGVLSMELPGLFADFHARGDPSSVYFAGRALLYLEERLGGFPMLHTIGTSARCARDSMHWPTKGLYAANKKSLLDEVILIDRQADIISVLRSSSTYEALVDQAFGIDAGGVADLTAGRFGQDAPPCGTCSNAMVWSDHEEDEYTTGWSCENVHRCGMTRSNSIEQGLLLRWHCSSCKSDLCRSCGKEVHLRSAQADPLYARIRDLHIDEAVSFAEGARAVTDAHASSPPDARVAASLHARLADHLRQFYDNRAETRRQEVGALADSEELLNTTEDRIDGEQPLQEALRLLCLLSVAHGGVPPAQLEVLQRAVLHGHGHRQAMMLANLERAGLLVPRDGWSTWRKLRKALRLMVPADMAADDICYAFNGYAPLSVRLVQTVWRTLPGKDWDQVEEVVAEVQEAAQDLLQSAKEWRQAAARDEYRVPENWRENIAGKLPELVARPEVSAWRGPTKAWLAYRDTVELLGPVETLRRQVTSPDAEVGAEGSSVLVVFLGGVTHGELGALRKLERISGRRLLVATSEILNAGKLLSSLGCPCESAAPASAVVARPTAPMARQDLW